MCLLGEALLQQTPKVVPVGALAGLHKITASVQCVPMVMHALAPFPFFLFERAFKWGVGFASHCIPHWRLGDDNLHGASSEEASPQNSRASAAEYRLYATINLTNCHELVQTDCVICCCLFVSLNGTWDHKIRSHTRPMPLLLPFRVWDSKRTRSQNFHFFCIPRLSRCAPSHF